MTLVIFQATPVGHYATSLHLFIQNWVFRKFDLFAIMRAVVLQIWVYPLLVKP